MKFCNDNIEVGPNAGSRAMGSETTVDSKDRCVNGANVLEVYSVRRGNKDHFPEHGWGAENEVGRGKLQVNLQAKERKV